MRIADSTMEEILASVDGVDADRLKSIIEDAKKDKKSLQETALKKQVITETELAKKYSAEIDIPYIDLSNKKIDKTTLKLIPERIAQKYRVVLFEMENDVPKLAMEDPDDLQAIDFLQKQLGQKLEIYIAITKDIATVLEEYKGNIGNEISKVVTESTEGDETEDEEEVDENDLAEDSPIAQTVNLLVEYAIKSKASDIHIEPRENMIQVRYRIDGVLREANKLPKKIMNALVSRIKILSNLKIDEHRAPQDGRFKISLNGAMFAMRVSTLPTVDGEKVVMRILDESSGALTLEDLGYWGSSLNRVKDAITQPYGIILVTGPTGSGKSTSLFSCINLLNGPGVNISTIEDPVEYKIPGVNQTQVNVKAGMTFAAGLRALLRQDPNIIMVGEIRDSETANLAIQAALTGHLVFATLHTNNAATALPRLLDMDIEPFLIASTVRAVVGQRLVRRIDPEHRENYEPGGDELKRLKTMFQVESVLAKARESQKEVATSVNDKKKTQEAGGDELSIADLEKKHASKTKVEATKKEAMEDQLAKELPTEISKVKFWRPKQDLPKGTSGYKGRVGIYEVLSVSTTIQQMIVGHHTADDIQEQAIKEGMLTMQQDGFVKAIQGITTLEEIMRVTRE